MNANDSPGRTIRTTLDPLVYGVVLAWNHWSDTRECLQSAMELEYPNYQLILVDNGSTDGTAAQTATDFPEVKVVRTEPNLGVAGGYNLGIRYALEQGADYVMIMNNDITLAPPMLRALVDASEANPTCGIVMPKIYHYYDRDRLWCAGARWRRLPPMIVYRGENAPDGPVWSHQEAIEFAPSCVLLIRSSVFRTAGLFDDQFHFYFDDWDFCLRARQAGFTILFVPAARMWHKVSVTTQKSERPDRWWRTMGASTVRFYLKHLGWLQLAGCASWWVVREILKGKWRRVPPYVAGLGDGLRQALMARS